MLVCNIKGNLWSSIHASQRKNCNYRTRNNVFRNYRTPNIKFAKMTFEILTFCYAWHLGFFNQSNTLKYMYFARMWPFCPSISYSSPVLPSLPSRRLGMSVACWPPLAAQAWSHDVACWPWVAGRPPPAQVWSPPGHGCAYCSWLAAARRPSLPDAWGRRPLGTLVCRRLAVLTEGKEETGDEPAAWPSWQRGKRKQEMNRSNPRENIARAKGSHGAKYMYLKVLDWIKDLKCHV